MKLQIDNLDGAGLRDYTASIDAANKPRLTRKLNQPSQLRFTLLQIGSDFVVPVRGARVLLGRTNGQDVFSGYISAAPEYEYLGWGERGIMYRYSFVALSDEAMLDKKRLPARSPFVARSAGDALRQLTDTLIPGAFDMSAVQNLDVLPQYVPDPQRSWSKHAGAIAREARAAYHALDGTITFAPLGAAAYALDEADADVSPASLVLQPMASIVNDATVIGDIEPQDYIRDYFVGDGLTSRFHLSQNPFTRFSKTIFSEEYAAGVLDPTRWTTADPTNVTSVSGGRLQIAGGDGRDGATVVRFLENIELGGAWVLQHGSVTFSAASSGILGGLYEGAVATANCLAGFQISSSGGGSQIQGLVNGVAVGTALPASASHNYVLTTRIYSQELYRLQQTFHAAAHPAGSGLGGTPISADVRIVLEVHDIDPVNPGTQVAASLVLYDGIISSAPGFCIYALVNSPGLQCSIAFTRLLQAPDTEVRSALSGQAYRTRLVGPLSAGGECNIVSGSTLDFFNRYVPALNELIEVRYRGIGRAMGRVSNPASVTSEQHGFDDGTRGKVLHLKRPCGRTSVDCENAALAIVSDGAVPGFVGRYETWSDFLPGGAEDLFPGDALNVNFASRAAVLQAIVDEVAVSFEDLACDHGLYTIHFKSDVADDLAFEFDAQIVAASEANSQFATVLMNLDAIPNSQVGFTTLPALTAATITQVTSTTASLDAGVSPAAAGGFEVRWSDAGWGQGNDQNLAGRFTSQTFTLPRLSKVQDYYIRQYDGSNPPKYSRYSAALHVDYPY